MLLLCKKLLYSLPEKIYYYILFAIWKESAKSFALCAFNSLAALNLSSHSAKLGLIETKALGAKWTLRTGYYIRTSQYPENPCHMNQYDMNQFRDPDV